MFFKHAVAQVLDASMAKTGGALLKDAHRHAFNYDPRPGFLYVRSRAISSRTNDNYDNFPAEEIKKAYRTFVGKPVFVNHHNENHRRARGVIVDAALHEDVTPGGETDTWVEVLMEVDAVNFPKLAQAILAGEIDRTSMGTDVEYSICSVCANRAETPLEYCKHIPAMKGLKVQRTTASGEKEEVLVYEKCYGLRFFENSLLVEEPADPTAYFLGVDDRGMQMTATAKRVRVAPDAKLAYGETRVPAPVDTLREESCPICGEADSYDGEECLVCGYMAPPDVFQDPDLDKAQEVDLRQEEGDDEIENEPELLQCDTCEKTFKAGVVKQSVFLPYKSDEEDEEDDEEEEPEPDAEESEDDESGEVEVEVDDDESADDDVPYDTPLSAGDACPECGEGTLKAVEDGGEDENEESVEDEPEGSDFPPQGESVDEDPDDTSEGESDESPESEESEEDDEEEEDDEDDDEDESEDEPMTKPKEARATRDGNEGDNMRPALKAIAKQDAIARRQARQIAALTQAFITLAKAAGLERDARVAALLKAATEGENPGVPYGWANPGPVAPEAPAATSEETLGEINNEAPAGGSLPDDPADIGTASESDVAPDAQTSLGSDEVVLDVQPAATQDVTAPVAGTENLGEGPVGAPGSTRTETEVRLNESPDLSPAFPMEEGGWQTEGRQIAALRLARLRLETGIDGGDDLSLATKIARSAMTAEAIQSEIETLSKVVATRARQERPAKRNLVPRSASPQRAVPSFQAPAPSVAAAPDNDEFLFD